MTAASPSSRGDHHTVQGRRQARQMLRRETLEERDLGEESGVKRP